MHSDQSWVSLDVVALVQRLHDTCSIIIIPPPSSSRSTCGLLREYILEIKEMDLDGWTFERLRRHVHANYKITHFTVITAVDAKGWEHGSGQRLKEEFSPFCEMAYYNMVSFVSQLRAFRAMMVLVSTESSHKTHIPIFSCNLPNSDRRTKDFVVAEQSKYEMKHDVKPEFKVRDEICRGETVCDFCELSVFAYVPSDNTDLRMCPECLRAWKEPVSKIPSSLSLK